MIQSSNSLNQKEQKHWKVCEAILNVIANEGLESLNLSIISKKSGVSRAWIYEYMGKDRKKLQEISAELFAAYFARTEIDVKLFTIDDLKKKINEGSCFAIEATINRPVFLKIFFRYRGTENIIGKTIAKFEQLFIKKFSKHLIAVLKIKEVEAEELTELLYIMRMFYCYQIMTKSVKKIDSVKSTEQLNKMQFCLLGLKV